MPVITRKMSDLKEEILAKIEEKFQDFKSSLIAEIREQIKKEVSETEIQRLKKGKNLNRLYQCYKDMSNYIRSK